MSIKRKLDDEQQAEAGPSTPVTLSENAGIHPDRLRALQALDAGNEPEAKIKKEKGPPKEKTEAQKRYNKKKTKKIKKVKAAQKAAAPKNKTFVPSGEEEAEAEGSTAPIIADVTEGKAEKKKKKKTTDEEDVEMAEAADEADEDPEVKAAREREVEKIAKKERREKRRAERAQEQIAAAQAEEAARKLRESLQAAIDAGEAPVVEEKEATPAREEEDLRATPEIEAMPSFPMPLPAAQPDQALLQQQGLPEALQHASFIDEARRLPLQDVGSSAMARGIDERMRKGLDEAGIQEFFAVQAALLPILLPLPLVPLPTQTPLLPDYLISAPTGSGKTLAYAIPLIHVLQQRIVTRLRALIILPTRDLVTQVRETLETLSRGTGLRIGTATGQHSFAHEQNALVGDVKEVLKGGSSKIDILIATPGRLMDHLTSTPNFTLQHLRFLIIDEADRLLGQSFQNWLPEVLAHTRAPTTQAEPAQATPGDAVAGAWMKASGLPVQEWEGSEQDGLDGNKLLFSATLTRDPSKIASLHLRHPRYFIVQANAAGATPAAFGEQFALPAGLKEKMVIMAPELKPLVLLHLLHSEQYALSSSLCFTKSVESATRLVKLIDYFEDAFILGGGSNTGKRIVAKSYSSELKEGERKRLLEGLAKGTIDVLVCSDLIARGIDLPSVANVISYDVPLDMRKYVHRVGRTARAGREGKAWSLVEKQEARHFKLMLDGANHREAVEVLKIKEPTLKPYTDSYKVSLHRLRETFGNAQ